MLTEARTATTLGRTATFSPRWIFRHPNRTSSRLIMLRTLAQGAHHSYPRKGLVQLREVLRGRVAGARGSNYLTSPRMGATQLLSCASSTLSSSASVEDLAQRLTRVVVGAASSSSASAMAAGAELHSQPPPRSVELQSWLQRLTPTERLDLAKLLRSASAVTATPSSTSLPATTGAAVAAAASTTMVSGSNPAHTAAVLLKEPTKQDLQIVALNTGIPFIGFGIMDNALLIIAGDAIDTSLGVTLGISTMCAAAIGNIISDVFGVLFGTAIEDFCAAYLPLPTPNLTAAQRQLRSVRYANQFGCGVGLTLGCIIGMFPLFFIDSNKTQARKQANQMDNLFRDVVTEAGSLVGAARTCLYILVDRPEGTSGQDRASAKSLVPTPEGKYLYARYGGASEGHWIPLGRGIVSRAALTGETWNIADAQSEPDLVVSTPGDEDVKGSSDPVRTMVCVPVLDGHGRTIAVLEAINKVGKGRGDPHEDDDEEENVATPWRQQSPHPRPFTHSDVQMLKALATHISVSLQRLSDVHGEHQADLRLKDTIRLLQDYGLAGIAEDRSKRTVRHRPLFPDDDVVPVLAS